MKPVLIQHGRVIDPESGIDACADVLVCRDQIAAMGGDVAAAAGDPVRIDAAGLLVVPGLVDVHVHFREPGFEQKETIATGSAAAAAGGFTAVVCEPNTNPPVDTVERARDMARRAALAGVVRVYQKAAITMGRAGAALTDFARLLREPAVKAISDDGDPVFDAQVMEAALAAAVQCGAVISPHCEDSGAAIRSRAEDPSRQGFPSAPDYENEPGFVARDVRLAVKHGARLHVSHLSRAESITAVRDGRRAGGAITCEAAPHHFCLDTDVCRERRLSVTVNPPIRGPEHRRAVLDAIADGTIDVIASDHAPHTAEDKARGVHGIIGLETTVGLVSTFLVAKGVLDWPRAIALMSCNPSRLFGLPGGSLVPGRVGDVTLIDPDLQWTVEPAEFRCKSRNCPYAGWRLRGRAVLTLCRNEIAYAHPCMGGRVAGAAGL